MGVLNELAYLVLPVCWMSAETDRAVAPVISTILFVAITVILAAVIATIAFDIGSETEDTGPVVGQSSGELVKDVDGSNDQIVRIHHIAGDPVTVSEIEIVVTAQCTDGRKTGRLVDLPENAVDWGGTDKVRGDDIFDGTSPEGGQLDPDADTFDGQWTAGETIRFRIRNGGCELTEGDGVMVRVVHTPTNAVVVKETLTAS